MHVWWTIIEVTPKARDVEGRLTGPEQEGPKLGWVTSKVYVWIRSPRYLNPKTESYESYVHLLRSLLSSIDRESLSEEATIPQKEEEEWRALKKKKECSDGD